MSSVRRYSRKLFLDGFRERIHTCHATRILALVPSLIGKLMVLG